tara:strand:- start:188 stop:523 length:336 start_codon:yes stop_codon:yes gene_type:complete
VAARHSQKRIGWLCVKPEGKSNAWIYEKANEEKEADENSGKEKACWPHGWPWPAEGLAMKPPGLYRNIAKKRARIKAQKKAGKTPERMRKVGSKGAPTAKAFKQSAKTARA